MTIEKTINVISELMKNENIKKNDNQYYGIRYDDIYSAYKRPSINKVKAFNQCEYYVKQLSTAIENVTSCPCECYLKGISSGNCQIFVYAWRYRIACDDGDITLFIKNTAYHQYYSFQ